MRNNALITVICIFVMSINAYCFDILDDTFDFIFDDLAKVIGVIVIVGIVVYFVKKFFRRQN